MCQFDPLDFIECVADRFDIDLPTDKLSFHQIGVLFTLIIVHRKSDDHRRLVRFETRTEKGHPDDPPTPAGVPPGPKDKKAPGDTKVLKYPQGTPAAV